MAEHFSLVPIYFSSVAMLVTFHKWVFKNYPLCFWVYYSFVYFITESRKQGTTVTLTKFQLQRTFSSRRCDFLLHIFYSYLFRRLASVINLTFYYTIIFCCILNFVQKIFTFHIIIKHSRLHFYSPVCIINRIISFRFNYCTSAFDSKICCRSLFHFK